MKERYRYLCVFLVCQLALSLSGNAQPVDSFLNLDIVVSIEAADAIRSKNLESSPVFYENGIVFVYARERAKLLDPKIGMPYFELMYSDLGPGGQPRKAVSFSSNIRSRFHEGPASFTGDYQEIFFTRSNTRNGQGVADEDKKIRLNIFHGTKGPEDWENIEALPFCADNYSSCHPAVSADGSRMIFSSDMPGGFGGMDLYLVEKMNGIWQTPVNLGPRINTGKNEIFPTWLPNGVLFFSSNGHRGSGGLDIYATHIGFDGMPAGFIHMPAPFNSREDDLGLIVDNSGMLGFLASERNGKKARDDIFLLKMSSSIFRFPESMKLDEPVVVEVTPVPEPAGEVVETPDESDPCVRMTFRIRSREGLSPLGGIKVKCSDTCKGGMAEAVSDREGLAVVCLSEDCAVVVAVTGEGYRENTFDFRTEPGLPDIWNIFLDREKENALDVDRIETGVTIVLDDIYYDFNKSAIQRGAAEELEELARVMKEYPSMRILLSAHTDSRGPADYNLELSERRAFAAKDFLVARGVEPDRIETEAKGESEIRNRCRDGVPCSESEHRFNRRSEVKVLHIDAPVQFRHETDGPGGNP